ncbi:MAG: hypothetical protein FRX48_04066 [Lasallia pustulata]|uniref:Uncharacterized protein n=1 Tax=Lasallia pustulata TaxID=136370 RepID=A0A5M8PTA1_9LECA|nr:MAG: hypothetical protein FRX48_04066 [Lasallia pustulata]
MDKVKGIAKGGWHPSGKDGKSKESWRGDFKGINQVAGWMGKGQDPNKEAHQHVPRPLGTLKDPTAFGPPPKNVNYHGGAAVPHTITPDRGGLGVPTSAEEVQAKQIREEQEAGAVGEAARKPAPPPVPYRADTTGLSTSNLPKPPVRQIERGEAPATVMSPVHAKPKPSLPPRLPPRQNSGRLQLVAPPPPSYNTATVEPSSEQGYINQGAISRLGAAGVSVPGLGIGERSNSSNPWKDQQSPFTSNTASGPANSQGNQLNELQSKFSKLSPLSQNPAPSSQGTSFAEKRAALKTASSFHKDPSSVSLVDARNTASTANNFRERHGHQVASGLKSASGLNQKYGISNRLNSYTSTGSTSPVSAAAPTPTSPSPINASLFAVKKPAPAPPPKRIGVNGSSTQEPPPVPLSSKPR